MTKLEKIKQLTSYSLEEIKLMNDKDFFSNITKLLAKGVITKDQHDWLNTQRTDKDIQEFIKIFGGHLVK